MQQAIYPLIASYVFAYLTIFYWKRDPRVIEIAELNKPSTTKLVFAAVIFAIFMASAFYRPTSLWLVIYCVIPPTVTFFIKRLVSNPYPIMYKTLMATAGILNSICWLVVASFIAIKVNFVI